MRLFIPILASILFLIVNSGSAQHLILENGTVPKAGIYRNIQELKDNSPSIPLNYRVNRSRYNIMSTTDYVYKYTIKVSKRKARRIGFVYGFSDGKQIYLNTSEPVWLSKHETYYKIDLRNRFSYFERHVHDLSNIQFAHTSAGMTTVGASNKRLASYIFDLETGVFTELNKKNIAEALAPWPELAEDYKKQQKNKEAITHFTKLLVDKKNSAL